MHPRRAIQRYVSGGLGRRREAALRRHLAGCESCRSYYESQIQLLRILSGAAGEPTVEEDERLLARVLDRANAEGLLAGSQPARSAERSSTGEASLLMSFLDRLVLRPIPSALAAAFVLTVIIAASVLPSWEAGPLAPAPAAVASIVEARGLLLDGTSLDGERARDVEIHDGRRLVTEAGGLAELALVSGGTIRIFPESRTKLEEGGRLVILDAGRVWCRVDASESPFVVRTPGGEARVLGTSFVVEHTDEGKTNVRVIEGRVEVVDSTGRGRVMVAGGRQTSMARGMAPTEPARYDTRQDESEWSRLWGRLLEALQRALRGVRGIFGGEEP